VFPRHVACAALVVATACNRPPVSVPQSCRVPGHVTTNTPEASALHQEIGKQTAAIKACYERALRTANGRRDMIFCAIVEMGIRSDGTVAKASVTSREPWPDLVACVKQVVATWRFQVDSEQEVVFPMAFQPGS